MIYKDSTPEPHTFNALHVFDTHYYRRDAHGNAMEHSPDDVFRRVCDFYKQRAGSWYEGFISDHADDLFDIQKRKFYTFNSPTYYNAHIDNKRPLMFACFLGNLKDDMESITYHVGRFAKVFQQGAGIGINIGALRPKGASIGDGGGNIAGKTGSSGAVSYMKLYNMTGEIVKSAGKRRAAIMIMIDDHHPDLLEFITCKSGPDRRNFENMNISVAVTDRFMRAVEDNGTWDLTWKDKVWATYPARELWNKIIEHAHRTGDPGIFFIDRANVYNPASMVGPIRCTNPCLVGDTLVATADGRDAVSIKQLAEEGKDVPVYCLDTQGELAIRTMRNPRVTGYKQPIYKVHLDHGSFRATGNHKVMLRDGTYKRVDELQPGDSLKILNKYTPSEEQQSDPNASRGHRYKMMSIGAHQMKMDHTMIAEHKYGYSIPEGYVVHHLNEDRMDNRPENLEIKLNIDHLTEHSNAEENGNFSGFSHEQIREHALILTKRLQRRFSVNEWQEYAAITGLPQRFTDWRIDALGTITSLSKWASQECGFDAFNDLDPRVVKTYQKYTGMGYDCDIVDGHVMLNKECKGCKETFQVDWEHSEIMYHSTACAGKYREYVASEETKVKMRQMIDSKQDKIKEQQLSAFTELKFNLGREPQKKEWVDFCRAKGVSPEVSRKSSPFKSWAELKESGLVFNHRVDYVEKDGEEDVYNGTVDDYHNFFFGGWSTFTKNGKGKTCWVLGPNCGEVSLPPSTACNLGALNLYQIALATKNAKNDRKALMSNIHEIAKIVFPFLEANIDLTVYPDAEFEKNTREIRPIGMGISGLGEMFFHLGMRFGSPESCQLASDIMEELTLTALEWSTTLPKEYSTPLLDSNEEIICDVLQKYQDISEQKDRWSKIIANVKEGHLRNLFVTTIAPTGNTGIAMDSVSGGCEPVYALGYTRNLSTGGKLKFVDPEFEKIASERQLDIDKVLANGGTLAGLENIPDDVKDVFVVANDIPWVDRVNMQSALQKFTTLSISSTLNVPNSTTAEAIGGIYMDAWRKQCKGITIFRDGCLDSTPLETTKSHENKENAVKSGVALGDVATEDINKKFAEAELNKAKMAEVVQVDQHCNRCEMK